MFRNTSAKDAHKIGPVRANKSISKTLPENLRRPDPEVKPNSSKIEADLLVHTFKELGFTFKEMEFTFLKQWPKCFGIYGT